MYTYSNPCWEQLTTIRIEYLDIGWRKLLSTDCCKAAAAVDESQHDVSSDTTNKGRDAMTPICDTRYQVHLSSAAVVLCRHKKNRNIEILVRSNIKKTRIKKMGWFVVCSNPIGGGEWQISSN